jgi:hypothetical protein
MSARIISISEARARRGQTRFEPRLEVVHESATLASDAPHCFHFWTGASGKRYVHTVYNLIECPVLPAANVALVRRDAKGRRTVLAITHVANDAPSLNLAEVRRRGAELGANEVHVHLLADTIRDIKHTEFDLRAGLFDAGAGASQLVLH